MKTKISTDIAHVTLTRTPLSRLKGQKSRSPGHFTQRGLNAQGGCSGQRGNVFGVRKYGYVASARRRARRYRAPAGEERGGDILCRHADSLYFVSKWLKISTNVFLGRGSSII